MVVQHIGPIHDDHYIFTVDGYKVPNLSGQLIDGENTWSLTFDGRFNIVCSDQELSHWLWFFANACAVSAGYTCFGQNSKPTNPFSTQVGVIEDVP